MSIGMSDVSSFTPTRRGWKEPNHTIDTGVPQAIYLPWKSQDHMESNNTSEDMPDYRRVCDTSPVLYSVGALSHFITYI